MSPTLGGILPACITPFKEDRVDPGAMAENIGCWLASGLDGVLVFGSTGEYVYLTDVERRPLLTAARRAVPPNRLLLVGCGAESTAAALRYLQEAADEGADAALVVTPVYYTRGDAAAQRRHYTFLADHSPIPVLLYSVAPYTAYDLPVDLILELAEHPNIVGIKDSSGDFNRLALQIRSHIPNFAVFAGSPTLIFPALSLGAAGSITALANIIPEIMVGIGHAVRTGDLKEAARLQSLVIGFAHAMRSFGIPGIKAVATHRGLRAGEPRAPLAPLSPAQTATAIAAWEQVMAQAGLPPAF
jgi:4-hydroxy-2-oxoglutarate aldolase